MRILVGTDFSQPARQALAHALSLAREKDSEVLVLHVIHAPELEELARLMEVPEKILRERLGRERRERLTAAIREADETPATVPVETILAWGHPYEVILKKASEASVSLIVLGTAGRSADLERALFGSTAEKVLRSAPCPVLCVPTE
ncbi:MAG TPA: universal stress protein [Candidatus Polarisedimenticolia bacterium]|jgi:nucleotide-binding universal stress UspA family protein|nr:universal stress protein [Candidatus Polarisedimenticolia bacterium]